MSSKSTHLTEIEAFLTEWFSVNSLVTREIIEKNMDEDYLLRGWIDSFKFITLVAEVEKRYDIHFSQADLQRTVFTTMRGLAAIIHKHLQK